MIVSNTYWSRNNWLESSAIIGHQKIKKKYGLLITSSIEEVICETKWQNCAIKIPQKCKA